MPSEALSLSSRRDFLRTVTVGTALLVANLALPARARASRLPSGRISLFNL